MTGKEKKSKKTNFFELFLKRNIWVKQKFGDQEKVTVCYPAMPREHFRNPSFLRSFFSGHGKKVSAVNSPVQKSCSGILPLKRKQISAIYDLG